jgi:hypothetical protein
MEGNAPAALRPVALLERPSQPVVSMRMIVPATHLGEKVLNVKRVLR